MHPDDLPAMPNPEELGDGWATGDESDEFDGHEITRDEDCEVPPLPKAEFPAGFTIPPVKQVDVVRRPGQRDPDLPHPFDGWTEKEWDTEQDGEDSACVPCEADMMMTRADWKKEALSTEHLLRHGKSK